MAKKKRTKDMHSADIVAELRKRKTSLAKLGEENNLAKTTLRNAFDKKYPKAEKIIAKAIAMKPEDIWPSRY